MNHMQNLLYRNYLGQELSWISESVQRNREEPMGGISGWMIQINNTQTVIGTYVYLSSIYPAKSDMH